MTDVTDATFEAEVMARSDQVPVVIDLWAPWCGPCRTLGPIIEKVVAAKDGAVALAKVNVDENPRISASFKVQSIPAVFALVNRKVVDSFMGALPEAAVAEFVDKLAPTVTEADRLVALGDEASLRAALGIDPDHPGGVCELAELLVDRGETDEALALLARIPETTETRRIAALARLGGGGNDMAPGGPESRLDKLLETVKEDPAARQEFLDLLEVLGPDDPRSSAYRRKLTARLF